MSPSSPGTPYYRQQLPWRCRLETAAENHLTSEANLRNDTQILAHPPTVHNLTPPGLRTPGTAPGTPGVPLPVFLSSKALEYFSKAATENGGSSSTSVILQSPDGHPQAMFFHHSRSSNWLRRNLINNSINGVMQSSNMGGSIISKLKLKIQSSSSQPMLCETISTDSNPEPMTLAQQVMANAEGTTRPSLHHPFPTRALMIQPRAACLLSQAKTLSQSVRVNNSTTNLLSGGPSDNRFPHVMEPFHPGRSLYHSQKVFMPLRQSSGSSAHSLALTPTPSTSPATPGVHQSGSTPLTKEQQHILMNPWPLSMLRMPSIPAYLPTSISVTIRSPCRLPGPQFPRGHEATSSGKSRPQNLPPVQKHRPASEEPHLLQRAGRQ